MSSTVLMAMLLSIASYSPSFLPNEIVWSNTYKLSWEDFSGEPNYRHRSDALTSSSIYFGYRFDGKRTYDVEVYASFFKDKSWIKEESPNGYLLRHEQGHFDLTEIYARKLRKELTRYAQNGRSLEKNYDRIFDKYFQLLEKEQDAYDHETHHSLDRSTQQKWDKYISDELHSLRDYSSIHMTIICNGRQ